MPKFGDLTRQFAVLFPHIEPFFNTFFGSYLSDDGLLPKNGTALTHRHKSDICERVRACGRMGTCAWNVSVPSSAFSRTAGEMFGKARNF